MLGSPLYEIVTLCFNTVGSRASHAQPFLCPELAGSGKFPCFWRNHSFDSVSAWLGTFSHVTTDLFMHRKLDNYLRTHRNRAGLSQDEVAYLLGCRSGAKVSRYERFTRPPTLQTALAYDAIFGVAVRDCSQGCSKGLKDQSSSGLSCWPRSSRPQSLIDSQHASCRSFAR